MQKSKREIIDVEGKLREIVTVYDDSGKVLHKMMRPLMLEFKPKDVLQVVIGATILAIPVGFTEETWKLGEMLPIENVIGFMLISLFFISAFVYYNYYRANGIKGHYKKFFKRVLSTYIISFLVVALLLTLIQKAPWGLNSVLAYKRTVLVAFPASMSAAIADMIK